LTSFEMGDAKLKSMATPATKSVILRFGGQVSTFIRLQAHGRALETPSQRRRRCLIPRS
jgi:hypothetical protein